MPTNFAHDSNPLTAAPTGTARATFRFRALDTDGREVGGTIAAASPQEVARRLRSEGKTVLSIGHDERIAATGAASRATRSSRARRSDLGALCRHLGTMAEAGVPLSEALVSAAEEGGREEFRPFVRQLATEVESGVPLSEAFGRRCREVPALVVA
ncbi:MAG: type II secretion system F family protein, partial [bacterium]